MHTPVTELKVLKKDIFGEVSLLDPTINPRVVRDARPASSWVRWLARRLLAREARALAACEGIAGIPEVLRVEADRLERSWIGGQPMHRVRPRDIGYYRSAARLLRRLHRRCVVHNDLAKEPNWLVTNRGRPGIIDFQLAWHASKRGRLFRMLAREDLRHLLKHKRTYCPEHLTGREKRILATPTVLSRVWTLSGKRIYLLVTRRLLGWQDREGAHERTGI